MISRISALVDALARLNGCHNPSSRAYKNRNPLLLKVFSEKHVRDADGYRIFSSWASGYTNSENDLTIKVSGKSHSKLQSTDTLRDLVKFFGNQGCAARGVKNFLRAALENDEIYENTKLEWFIEDTKVKEIGE